MTHTPTSTAAPAVSAVPGAGDRVRHGAIHLQVTDLDRARAFWGDALGLGERSRDGDALHLGTPDRDLIVLRPGATRAAARGHAGLYHVAFHVPTERDFAQTMMRLAAHRVPQAPTDHIFSIATYANDADGLGLEVTFETPERVVSNEVNERSIALIDADGRRRAPTESLDVGPILERHGGEGVDPRIAPDTVIGHVHLHVAGIPAAAGFYRDIVGFDEHMRMDRIGMADFSAGGRFPHRMAVNVWQGQGAPQVPGEAARMLRHELRVSHDDLAAIAGRMDSAGHAYQKEGDAIITRDPAGNPLEISTRAV